jgi:DNA-directed RNA polymerase specialized sigma24 family protein
VATVGGEQNIGVIHRKAEDLARREVEAWLQENRAAQVPIEERARDAASYYQRLLAPFLDVSGKYVPHGLKPEDKCEHGHYLGNWCCGLCRDGKEHEPEFRVDAYAAEIGKAIYRAKPILKFQDFQELQQECLVEIWKATKSYGPKMNEKVAYTIAVNTRKDFLEHWIRKKYLLSVDEDGDPVLNNLGLDLGLDGGELRRIAENESLPAEERDKAQHLLYQYQVKVPRFQRYKPPKAKSADSYDEDSGPDTDAKLSRKENLRKNENTLVRSLDAEKLRPLVGRWFGDKRKVAEAILTEGNDFALMDFVRDSRIPESTARRLYTTVLKEFKKYLEKKRK